MTTTASRSTSKAPTTRWKPFCTICEPSCPRRRGSLRSTSAGTSPSTEGVHDSRERAVRAADRADRARSGRVRRVPRRAVRSHRPAFRIPLHQLHQLRAALYVIRELPYDRRNTTMEAWPLEGFVWPNTRILTTGDFTPSRWRVRRAVRGTNCSLVTSRLLEARPASAAPRTCSRGRDRCDQGTGWLSPRVRCTQCRSVPLYASGSTARKSRSP